MTNIFLDEVGYEYDDIMIVPAISNNPLCNSRDTVKFERKLFSNDTRDFCVPIMSAPMKGISGVELVKALSDYGGYGILHRFDDITVRRENVNQLSRNCDYFGVAVGLRDFENELRFAKYAQDWGAGFICLDVANGYTQQCADSVRALSDTLRIPVVAGNVAERTGCDRLIESGADMVRVGIGGGSVCTTRNKTGIGVPSVNSIWSVVCEGKSSRVIADGGISDSGKAAKAFAIGATAVMLGGLFAKVCEAESSDGIVYGMASKRNNGVKSIEGMEVRIDVSERIPLAKMLDEFIYGIKSAMTYTDSPDLDTFYKGARFIRAGTNSLKNLGG